MLTVFPLPDLGEGLTESEVLSWHVKEGDEVTLNQILGEVETAKAVVELPSPFSGVIEALHAAPGEVVQVGRPLITFEVEGEAPVGSDESSAEKRTPTLVGYGAAVGSDAPPRRRRSRRGSAPAQPAADPAPSLPDVAEAPAAEPAPAAAAAQQTPAASVLTSRPRATPPVRKLARDHGVDLNSLVGSGPDGLILRSDVTAAAGAGTVQEVAGAAAVAGAATAAGPQAGRAMGAQPGGDEEWDVPVRGVRKATAAAMVASSTQQPQVTEFLTVDVTRTMKLVRRLREDRAWSGVRVSPLAVVAKAVCLALATEPGLNATWMGESIRFRRRVDLGIAVATERGLVVPHVPAAQGMSLRELAGAIGELAGTAREGRTPAELLRGGTFTITNVGVFGVDAGTPLLNPGQSGILAMGAVRRQPWEHRGKIKLREVMTLAITFDHRVVDGAEGSRFLATVGALLEDPGATITVA